MNEDNKKIDDELPEEHILTDEEVAKEIKRQLNEKIKFSFFLVFFVFIIILAVFMYISNEEKDGELPNTLRKAHEFNEKVTKTYFNPAKLAPTFDKALAAEMKPNGDIGMEEPIDFKKWKLNTSDTNGTNKSFSIEDIKKLPSFEMTTEFKCVEGWSKISNWKGVKLVDFLKKNNLLSEKSKYVYLETPDKKYFVGLDLETAKHPQTLLAYEMNGKPLTIEHGAPLRLVTPLKYGIKQIKRIGTIKITEIRPKDYWAEQGYDWYAGH